MPPSGWPRSSAGPDRKGKRPKPSQPEITRMSAFFFNDTATPEIYPLSLHDALPISMIVLVIGGTRSGKSDAAERLAAQLGEPRSEGQTAETQSTRNNSDVRFFF